VRGKQKEDGRWVRHGDLADWRGVVWAGAPMVSAVRRASLAINGPVARLAFRRWEADGLAGVTWALEGAEDPERAVFWPDGPVAPVSSEGRFEAACLGLSVYEEPRREGNSARGRRRGLFLVVKRIYGAHVWSPMYERLGVGSWDASADESDPFKGAERFAVWLF
jgi:hypothetical protein